MAFTCVRCVIADCRNYTTLKAIYCFLHNDLVPAPGTPCPVPRLLPGVVVRQEHGEQLLPRHPQQQNIIRTPPRRANNYPASVAPIESPQNEEKGEFECAICYNQTDNILDCKHSICNKCLGKLRKYECPVCRAGLSGEIITGQVFLNIETNIREDTYAREEENRRQAERAAADPNYDPNRHYGL